VLSAYRDNAAVIEAPAALDIFRHTHRIYGGVEEPIDILMKVETHNIQPHFAVPGASTGSGGGDPRRGCNRRGAKPKAGLTALSVSNLRIRRLRAPLGAALRQAGAHRLRRSTS